MLSIGSSVSRTRSCILPLVNVQLTATHAVPESNQRTRHLIAEVIDQVKQVPCVIIPRRYRFNMSVVKATSLVSVDLLTIISQFVFIENVTHALVGHIRNPDTPNAKPKRFRPQ